MVLVPRVWFRGQILQPWIPGEDTRQNSFSRGILFGMRPIGGNTYWLIDPMLDFTCYFSFHVISIVEGQHPAPVDLVDFLLITVLLTFQVVLDWSLKSVMRWFRGIECLWLRITRSDGLRPPSPFLSVWLDKCWYFHRFGMIRDPKDFENEIFSTSWSSRRNPPWCFFGP